MHDAFWIATICGGPLLALVILDVCRVRIERWRKR